MSITLDLKPGLEAALRDQAEREGVDLGTLAIRALEQTFKVETSTAGASREDELLLSISKGTDEAIWNRYHALSAKRDAETLTPGEHQELITLSQSIEAADVARLGYMAELAKLRGISLRELRAQVGIPAHDATDGPARA